METIEGLNLYPTWPNGRTKMIQEIFIDEPWKMLIGCILLNRTSHIQVREVIWKLFERWPTPEDLCKADEKKLVEMLRPLGFYNRRARTLLLFTKSWLLFEGDLESLYGIGKYAKDSWEIFINKRMDVKTEDKVLLQYLKVWSKT